MQYAFSFASMSNILDISPAPCYTTDVKYIRHEVNMIEKMKTARLKKGLSQAELAKNIGVSRQTINMIENSGYNPTVELCIKICKELGVTLNDLFWEE